MYFEKNLKYNLDKGDQSYLSVLKQADEHIEKNNLEKLNNYLNKILSLIKKPMRFSRFTGYGDKGLWNYVKIKSRNIKSL